jgi:hypothetical protein
VWIRLRSLGADCGDLSFVDGPAAPKRLRRIASGCKRSYRGIFIDLTVCVTHDYALLHQFGYIRSRETLRLGKLGAVHR